MQPSPTPKPACFDTDEQYQEWLAAAHNVKALGGKFTSDYCTDCTPEHKAKMECAGRCAFPGTKFVRNQEGGLYGRRPR